MAATLQAFCAELLLVMYFWLAEAAQVVEAQNPLYQANIKD